MTTKETSLLYSNGRWVSLGEIEKLVERAATVIQGIKSMGEHSEYDVNQLTTALIPFSPKNPDKTGAPEEKGVDRVKELEAQVAELERRLDHQYERGYNDGKKESGGIW